MQISECDICGGRSFALVVRTAEMQRELQMQHDFVFFRLARKALRPELKDLTDFMHGFPAPLVECRSCGVLTRAERRIRATDSYEEDRNDLDLMDQVYLRYVEAFRNKRAAYEPLLKPRADVLELGSHVGAFLQTAEECDWRPTGLDVGRDTSEFVRGHGFSVFRQTAEDSSHHSDSFDGAFIWNCFEQLTEPASTLLAVHKLLKRHGLLVIRVPNVMFYRTLSRELEAEEDDSFVMRAMAYNNLLGFPYLHGYTADSLNQLVTSWGFEFVRGFNSELVTMPFADITRRIEEEQTGISRGVAEWSSATTQEHDTLTGPWIELVYRRLEEGPARPMSPRKHIDLRFLPRAS
jgi:2-polyprenyl-3-methyl-5-hydroxy-6-metoxy-1,4-benzoquinol methylase